MLYVVCILLGSVCTFLLLAWLGERVGLPFDAASWLIVATLMLITLGAAVWA